MATKSQILKDFFSAPGHPVTNSELIELLKADKPGYDELVQEAAKALGVEVG